VKLSENLNSALNEQVTHEMRNVSIYRQIQSYFEGLQLKHIGNYFKEQADHEFEHANMIIEHINSRIGGIVTIQEISEPIIYSSVDEIAISYVSVEEMTTNSLESLYGLALLEKSYIDIDFLSEMLKEQVEEENSAITFATKLKTVSDLVLFDLLLTKE